MNDHRPDEFDDIRRLLAGAPQIEPRVGALDRIIDAVAAAPDPVSPVIDLAAERADRSHRRVPRLAAAAVVLAIVGAVVGGVGADTRIPAVGDLAASHAAASADVMPATAHEMPMDEAHAIEPVMPDSMSVTAAFVEADDTVHLVYGDERGGVVSVFRQVGDADLDQLSADGSIEMMGDTPVWSTVVEELHVAVIDGDGFVWTVVADHHDEAMMTVMSADLPSRSPSLLDRALDVADAVVDPWRLGG